uniref:CobW C-terminal domain-containing protein n=1 Tax=Eucampia antarctica TaxID=49252 RepID=A0A7S2R1L9_9STRA|mmetsp:Transcript_11473/g.10987  ORF Transcript_11473/g.10987 Transcript_11473/m.10987 type:complete len:653 (+) Transcript_11473:91-2049(+)
MIQGKGLQRHLKSVVIAITMVLMCSSSLLRVYAGRSSRRNVVAFSSMLDRSMMSSRSRITNSRAPLVVSSSIGFSSPLSLGWHSVGVGSDLKMSTSITNTDITDGGKMEAIPITLLAGFLGSGKTSTLKHLLENKEGVRIGVIVNDVASVNIDNKLISREAGDTVELQNGCACCSLADELLTSVEIVTDNGKRPFDAIIVELSGIADPVAVTKNWEAATLTKHPATKLAKVSRVVTLIDSCTFGTDWMTWDSSGDREGWVDPGDECAAAGKVPELLVEQVEAADLLLINKVDLAGAEQVEVASTLAKALNDKAQIFEVKYGAISPQQILGNTLLPTPNTDDATTTNTDDCDDPTCTDNTHDHSHGKDEHEDASSDCSDPTTCNDPTHDHSHNHEHDVDGEESDCSDPTCDDPTHDHSHSQNEHQTSADKLGITNFVYKASVPFFANRLLVLLSSWPVPIKDELDLGQINKAAKEGYDMDDEDNDTSGGKSPFTGVLRSKGFCWLAPTAWTGLTEDTWRHDTAMYWSHAGKHFGINTAGKWWGTLTKEQMKQYFANNEKEYNRIIDEDWVTEQWGDRRQELVFIGTGIDEKEITEALNDCLCTDEEMKQYESSLRNLIDTTFTTEAIRSDDPDGPSLFDVGGTDHMDLNVRGD